MNAQDMADRGIKEFDAVDIVAEGFATQPYASQFDLDNNNGLRFTVGATTRVGDLEADVWILNQSDHLIAIDPVRRFDLLILDVRLGPYSGMPDEEAGITTLQAIW